MQTLILENKLEEAVEYALEEDCSESTLLQLAELVSYDYVRGFCLLMKAFVPNDKYQNATVFPKFLEHVFKEKYEWKREKIQDIALQMSPPPINKIKSLFTICVEHVSSYFPTGSVKNQIQLLKFIHYTEIQREIMLQILSQKVRSCQDNSIAAFFLRKKYFKLAYQYCENDQGIPSPKMVLGTLLGIQYDVEERDGNKVWQRVQCINKEGRGVTVFKGFSKVDIKMQL